MKWRATFVALALLGLFYYGPRLNTGKCGKSRNRIGRNLLQDTPVEDTEPKECHQPSCHMSLYFGQGGEIYPKLAKAYFVCVDDPEDVKLECKDSNVAKERCMPPNIGDQAIPHNPLATVTLTVTSNACLGLSWICTGTYNNSTHDGSSITFVPPVTDAMFPKDAFTDSQRANGAIVLHIIGVLYMFYALALVCDHYFVPTLDVIIDKYNISPDVAGATLMAAGGSAPELFTSIIGVFIAVSDVGIGTIVGSAVFNVLFVIAACAFASAKALELTAWPLIRDTTFYSIALMMLVGFFTDDKIEWWEALILFIWYLLYVAFMKINGRMEKIFITKFPKLAPKGDNEDLLPAGFKWFPNRKPLLAIMKGKVDSSIDGEDADKKTGLVGLQNLMKGEEGEKLNHEQSQEGKAEGDTAAKEVEEEYVDYIRGGPGDGILSKIAWLISLPLMFPMWITIPDPQDPARKKWFPLSFLISILWIAVFSYFMVWWASLAGQTFGISDAVMGLTFLAAGTSVPDLITSVLVAKEGKGDMAVSSSIGSNLFDVTVGLPLPWLIYTAVYQKSMDVSSIGMGCSIGMLFIMLILVFLSILLFNWKMTKPMGVAMLGFYVVFVVVSLGLSQCWFECFLG